MGLINAGTAIGSLLAPPLIGLVLWLSGWRMVFVISGGFGMAVGCVVGHRVSRQSRHVVC